jgi:hypothetical protein
VLATLIAAMAGGKTGERFHHKVDRFGLAASTRRGRVRAD